MPRRHRLRVKQQRKRLLRGVLFLLVAGGLGWALFFAPFFSVKALAIEGAQSIARDKLKKALAEIFPEGTNILFIHTGLAARRIEDAFPEIKQAKIDRTLFRFPSRHRSDFLANIVTVVVQERRAAGVACRESCFFFDPEGVLFRSAEASASPFVNDKRNVAYGLGYQVFAPEIADRLAEIVRRFQGSDITVKTIELTDYESTLITQEGWSLIVAHSRPLDEQVEAARLVLEKEIGPRRGGLEYIDATIKNRVYYRFRGENSNPQ